MSEKSPQQEKSGDEGTLSSPLKSEASSELSSNSEESSEANDAVVSSLAAYVQTVSSSPFPPPELLREYDECLGEGTSERIMKMFESEIKHRRGMEAKQLETEISDVQAERRERRLGQWLGFLIGIVAIIGGAVTSIYGNPIAGGFIGTAGVVGLTAVFVLGRFPGK